MNIRDRRTYLLGLSKDNLYFLCGALNASKATRPEEQAANLFSAGSWPWDGRAHLRCWCCSLNLFLEMSPRTHRLAPRTYSGLPLFPCVRKKTSSHKPRHFFINSKWVKINKAINDNLERQATAYFQELFVANANPNWKTGTISSLGTVIGGSTPSKAKPEYYTDNGIAWITPKDLSINKSKFISHGETDITELGLKNSSASIMPEGTVLFSSRAPIGYIAISNGEVTTNQGFKSVVPKPEIGTAFVYFFLKNNLPTIEGAASGSTFKEVSGSTMKNVPAVIPDTGTLAKFNDFCSLLFNEQKNLEQENQHLASLRDTLLPKLMSGEIDVSNIQL